MEAVRTSETSVNFCQTTRRNIPEDSHLRTRLKSHLRIVLLTGLMSIYLLNLLCNLTDIHIRMLSYLSFIRFTLRWILFNSLQRFGVIWLCDYLRKYLFNKDINYYFLNFGLSPSSPCF
jgi:hypothetical protein